MRNRKANLFATSAVFLESMNNLRKNMIIKHIFKSFIALCLLCSFTLAQKNNYTNLFNEQELKSTVKFLSDDGFEGRAPGSRGGELAAKYAAMQLQKLGI